MKFNYLYSFNSFELFALQDFLFTRHFNSAFVFTQQGYAHLPITGDGSETVLLINF